MKAVRPYPNINHQTVEKIPSTIAIDRKLLLNVETETERNNSPSKLQIAPPM
jgi:hypothetical protein